MEEHFLEACRVSRLKTESKLINGNSDLASWEKGDDTAATLAEWWGLDLVMLTRGPAPVEYSNTFVFISHCGGRSQVEIVDRQTAGVHR